MAQRRAVTVRLAKKYRQATRAEKSEILDQLVELTGWHRDHARAELRRAGTVRVGGGERKARTPTYSARVVSGLEQCWRVARCPAGKRLAPMLAVLVPMLRRDGELDLTDAEADLLMGMSPPSTGPSTTAPVRRSLVRQRRPAPGDLDVRHRSLNARR